jgi:superfamily I DNA/RNA helicase
LVRRRIDVRLIQEAFENAGVPFEIIRSKEYFKEPIFRATVAYLKVLEDPAKNRRRLECCSRSPPTATCRAKSRSLAGSMPGPGN